MGGVHALCPWQNAAARTHYPPAAENAAANARLYAGVLRGAHNVAREGLTARPEPHSDLDYFSAPPSLNAFPTLSPRT